MGYRIFRLSIIKLAAMVMILLPATAMTEPRVAVSLKPLELLVRAIATEDTRVTTLVGPGANPHNYSMKPSQRRALGEAEAIFWVGPKMETFLARLLNGEDFRARSHAFLPGNGNGTDGKEEHRHNHEHEHDHEHNHHHHDSEEHPTTENDPHIWLDPAISLNMARKIKAVLSSLPGADKMALDANLKNFEESLAQTESEINQQLEPARSLSLFTYHNAFAHFAAHYELPLVGVLSLNPELSPGARHIAKVQNRLRKASRPCLMTERPFAQDSWEPIVGDITVSFSEWDPLASDIVANADGYIAFQRSIAKAVLECL